MFLAKSALCRIYCEALYQYARCVRVHGSGVRRIMRNLEGFLASADLVPSLVRSEPLIFGRYLEQLFAAVFTPFVPFVALSWLLKLL